MWSESVSLRGAYYNHSSRFIAEINRIYAELKSSGISIIPEINLITSQLFLSLLESGISKTDAEIQSAITELKNHLNSFQQRQYNARDFSQLLKRYQISILASPSVKIIRPGKINLKQDASAEVKYQLKEKDEPLLVTKACSDQLLQRVLAGDQTLTVDESVQCIHSCITMSQATTEQHLFDEVVFIVGNTGVGKSTCLNYFYGCDMVREKHQMIVSPHSKIPAVAAIGHGLLSKTFLPQITTVPGSALTFCDTPGFHDTRSPELRIVNAVNIRKILLSAKLVKILILMNTNSIIDPRKRDVTELLQILTEMFGSFSEMSHFSEGVLIGITRPNAIDGEPVMLDQIREILREDRRFPSRWIENTFLIDPLQREIAGDRFGPSTWIEKIKHIPAASSSLLYKTALVDEDICHLMKVCRTISERLMAFVSQGLTQAAANDLLLLSQLRMIEHPEVERLYQESLSKLIHYVQDKNFHIKDLVDSKNPNAQKEMQGLEHLIRIFADQIPQLKEELQDVTQYKAKKETQLNAQHVYMVVTDVASFFYQAILTQTMLAKGIVDVLSFDVFESTQDDDLEKTIKILCALATIPILGQIISENMDKVLDFSNKSDDIKHSEQSRIVMAACVDEMKQMFMAAKQLYQEKLVQEWNHLDLTIQEMLSFFAFYIQWHTNGRWFLSVFSQYELIDKFEFSVLKLDALLNALLPEPSLMSHVLCLRAALLHAYSLAQLSKNPSLFEESLQKVSQQILVIHAKNQQCLDIEEKHQQEILTQQEELECRMTTSNEQRQLHCEKLKQLQQDLQNAQNEYADCIVQQQALRDKTHTLNDKQVRFRETQWQQHVEKENCLAKQQLETMQLTSKLQRIDNLKQKQTKQGRSIAEHKKLLEDRLTDLRPIQEKDQISKRRIDDLQAKYNQVKDICRAKKLECEQRQQAIVSHQMKLDGQKNQIEQLKATTEAKKREKLLRLMQQQSKQQPQVYCPTQDEVTDRYELKQAVSKYQQSLRLISYRLKNKGFTHPSPALNIEPPQVALELFLFEVTIAKQMERQFSTTPAYQLQQLRVARAEQSYHQMLLHYDNLLKGAKQYDPCSSFYTEDILQDMKFEEVQDELEWAPHLLEQVVRDPEIRSLEAGLQDALRNFFEQQREFERENEQTDQIQRALELSSRELQDVCAQLQMEKRAYHILENKLANGMQDISAIRNVLQDLEQEQERDRLTYLQLEEAVITLRESAAKLEAVLPQLLEAEANANSEETELAAQCRQFCEEKSRLEREKQIAFTSIEKLTLEIEEAEDVCRALESAIARDKIKLDRLTIEHKDQHFLPATHINEVAVLFSKLWQVHVASLEAPSLLSEQQPQFSVGTVRLEDHHANLRFFPNPPSTSNPSFKRKQQTKEEICTRTIQ